MYNKSLQINKEEEKLNTFLDASLVEIERHSMTPANISSHMQMKFTSPYAIKMYK